MMIDFSAHLTVFQSSGVDGIYESDIECCKLGTPSPLHGLVFSQDTDLGSLADPVYLVIS